MGPQIAGAGLELCAVKDNLELLLLFYHPSVGITGMCHCTWPSNFAQEVEDVHALPSFIPLDWLPFNATVFPDTTQPKGTCTYLRAPHHCRMARNSLCAVSPLTHGLKYRILIFVAWCNFFLTLF